MRELVTGLMRFEDNSRPAVDAVLQPFYQDIYDHVLRVNDTIEGLRDLITTIYETRLSLNDFSLNTVTRQLAAWAAIIAVPHCRDRLLRAEHPVPGVSPTQWFRYQHRVVGWGFIAPIRQLQATALALTAQKLRRSGIPDLPPASFLTPRTWCNWMLSMSKPTRDAAM